MSNKKKIIIDSYTYVKSDVIPTWVHKLDELKSKIRANIHSTDGKEIDDVKFCHPINVPNTKK